MIKWHGTRTHDHFIYRRVEWPSFMEKEDYRQINGGSASESLFSDLKVSGKINYEGDTVPSDRDMVRVYYSFTDENGEVFTEPIITGFLTLSETTHKGALIKGSADISSVLSVLSDDGPGYAFIVAAGGDLLATAKHIVSFICDLPVNMKEPETPKTVRNNHVFEREDSWLTIVNWLLTTAGYSSCYPDAMGVVQMQPYVEPTYRETVWTFADDDKSVILPEVKESDNTADTPNIVHVGYEDSELGSFFAMAMNNDINSHSSIAYRQRSKRIYMTADNVPKKCTAPTEIMDYLVDEAKKKLIDNSTDIRYMDIQSLYVPVFINDCIKLDYTRADVAMRGSVTAREIKFDKGAPMTTTMREMIRPDFKITATAQYIEKEPDNE